MTGRRRGKPPPETTTIPPRSQFKDRKLFLEQVARAYTGDKWHRPMTVREVADILGVSWSVAHRYLRDAGVTFRGRGPDKDPRSSRVKRRASHPKGKSE